MLYQSIVAICLFIFMVNLILNLRSLHGLGDENKELPKELPLISVLIPARNEDEDIIPCLKSLLKQDYPNYEILVLDDNSSDKTAQVIEQIAATDDRIRLLKGKLLPRGWAGKPFACHQLAAEARGSWLLFTDADTVHAPQMLRSALSYVHKNNLSLLSGFPLQHCVSFSQRVVVPAMYFIILTWLPLWWVQSRARPKPGLVIGQFIFVSAQAYREIGGHEAVKSRILEDVWLGVEMARHGKRQATVDLHPMVSCRMYEGVGELWEGFSKWTYSVSSLSPWALILMMVAGFSLFVFPFYWTVCYLLPITTTPADWTKLILFQFAVVIFMRILVDQRFHYARLYSLSHPVGICFMLFSAAYGTVRRYTRAGVWWKERLYKPDSKIE